jgi:hypothetical protein
MTAWKWIVSKWKWIVLIVIVLGMILAILPDVRLFLWITVVTLFTFLRIIAWGISCLFVSRCI